MHQGQVASWVRDKKYLLMEKSDQQCLRVCNVSDAETEYYWNGQERHKTLFRQPLHSQVGK